MIHREIARDTVSSLDTSIFSSFFEMSVGPVAIRIFARLSCIIMYCLMNLPAI